MSPRRAVLVAWLVAIVSGCAAAGPGRQISGAYPGVCAQLSAQLHYSMRHCDAIVSRAVDEAALDRSSIAEIDISWVDDGLARSGAYGAVSVRFHMADGQVVDHAVMCGGIMGAYDPACGDDAKVSFGSSIDRDVPCSGEPPAGCATFPPTPPPDLATSAHGLRVASLGIPIDHAGHYEQRIGSATLPNGYLSELTARLVDDQPATFWITEGRVEIRPDIAGRPPVGSIYRDPYKGLEPVTVFIVFDVVQYVGPGVLRFQDIAVR